jgi:hypothetical protein
MRRDGFAPKSSLVLVITVSLFFAAHSCPRYSFEELRPRAQFNHSVYRTDYKVSSRSRIQLNYADIIDCRLINSGEKEIKIANFNKG